MEIAYDVTCVLPEIFTGFFDNDLKLVDNDLKLQDNDLEQLDNDLKLFDNDLKRLTMI